MRKRDLAVALVGPVLVLALFVVYLASPGQWVQGVDLDNEPTLLLYDAHGQLLPGAERGFYLAYILEESYREYQLVEMITFGCSLLAGVLGLAAFVVLLRQTLAHRPEGVGPVGRFLAPAVVGATALAAIFFAGEEVNWGQTFTRWGISEFVNHAPGDEPYAAQSIHNTWQGLSIQSLGSAYLLGVLVLAPVLWRYRERWSLPAFWAPAVACWPAGFTVVYAYVVKECKPIYLMLFGDGPAKLDPTYMGYFEQLNEQKEMLLALGMLIYLSYALGRAICGRGGKAGAESDSAS
ncbi:MAG: hypothetical protein ACIAXF_17845 [Phycisphaerales bacterium JB063]